VVGDGLLALVLDPVGDLTGSIISPVSFWIAAVWSWIFLMSAMSAEAFSPGICDIL